MAILDNGLETIERGSTTWRLIINQNFAKLTTAMTLSDFYTKDECDDKFALKTDVYTKSEADDRFLTPAEVNGQFYTKSESDDLYYEKTYIDDHFYDKTYIDDNIYTKTECDDLFVTKTYLADNYYTKNDIDSNFYTKSQCDSNYYSKSYINNNYYTASYIDDNFCRNSDCDSGVRVQTSAQLELSSSWMNVGVPYQDLTIYSLGNSQNTIIMLQGTVKQKAGSNVIATLPDFATPTRDVICTVGVNEEDTSTVTVSHDGELLFNGTIQAGMKLHFNVTYII